MYNKIRNLLQILKYSQTPYTLPQHLKTPSNLLGLSKTNIRLILDICIEITLYKTLILTIYVLKMIVKNVKTC